MGQLRLSQTEYDLDSVSQWAITEVIQAWLEINFGIKDSSIAMSGVQLDFDNIVSFCSLLIHWVHMCPENVT